MVVVRPGLDDDEGMKARTILRAITADEVRAYRACMADTFGFDLEGDPDGDARVKTLVDFTRTYCSFDGDALVATAGTYAFTLSVCGGELPMAGLTQVAVRSTYRRQGILRRAIEAHLDDAAAHGEPISGLWASEGPIYGRFGYGIAAESDDVLVQPDPGFAPASGDTIVGVDLATAAARMPGIYTRARATRPGMFSRTESWWHYRRILDRADLRGGRTPRQHVLVTRGDDDVGYASYRLKLHFEDGRAAGTVDLEELVAIDGAAEATLWHHVTNIDLHPKASYWNLPVDALVPWLATDARRVLRRRRADTLWLRILDVAAALAGRRYLADDRLRLAIHDPRRGLARWELCVEDGVARCDATTAAPELELDVAALGSIYLGHVRPSLLGRAGKIRGTPEALARADRLFTWPIAPWCAEVF